MNRLSFLVGAFLVIACSSNGNEPGAAGDVAIVKPATRRVACVGDSITAARTDGGVTYPSELAKILGAAWTVENDGHSGATLMKLGDVPYWRQSGYTRSTAFAKGGGFVIVALGTNDARTTNKTQLDLFTDDCVALVHHYQAIGVRVLVSLPPPAPAPACCTVDPVALEALVIPSLRDCAVQTGAGVIDVHRMFEEHLDLLSADHVHPSPAGYAAMAKVVATAIQNELE